jgi:cell wall-associated NlpC family hydrolase
MHQVLFNETVEILKETPDEYHINILNLFYVTDINKKQQAAYWVDKKAILPYSSFNAAKTTNFIPQPIDFRPAYVKTTAGKQPKAQATIVLTKPLYNKTFNMIFSAGTRFVAHPPHSRFAYTVCAWHPHTHKMITIKIPKSYAILQSERTPDEALSLYVELLKSWAHTKGFIPYVWGGCSFSYTHPADAPFCLYADENNKSYAIAYDTNTQKSGFDCAGLIARAAQTAGIPYYYKNTATLATHLNPISGIDDLKEGDLIWIPGHVMAVASLKQNTLIEARHYSQGYGKIHEIPLNKVFKGINSYKDLLRTIKKNTVLERLDSKGKPVQMINRIKILSIIS